MVNKQTVLSTVAHCNRYTADSYWPRQMEIDT